VKPVEAFGGSKESKTDTVVILRLVLSALYSACFGLAFESSGKFESNS
jgi:hypothetical protein